MTARTRPTLAAAALAALSVAALLGARTGPPPENLPLSKTVLDKRGRVIGLDRTSDGKYRVWTPLGDVSPLMVRATDLQEQEAPRSMGATPLATSVASLMYGLEGRSLSERARLAWRALEVQARYSRERQLELYLNLASYGGNVQGVGAASLIYFDKNADQLNLTEALTLSVIPRHPVRRILAGRPNRADQGARGLARRRLSSRWRRPDGPAASAGPSERLESLRRLARYAGEGPVAGWLDRGLERLSQAQSERRLGERLTAGELP